MQQVRGSVDAHEQGLIIVPGRELAAEVLTLAGLAEDVSALSERVTRLEAGTGAGIPSEGARAAAGVSAAQGQPTPQGDAPVLDGRTVRSIVQGLLEEPEFVTMRKGMVAQALARIREDNQRARSKGR